MEENRGYWGITRGTVIGLLLFLQTLLVESMSKGSLVGIDGLLNSDVEKSILAHGFWTTAVIGVIILGIHIYSQWAANKFRNHATLNRICEHIFNLYVRDIGVAGNHQFKVSFLVPSPCRSHWYSIRKKGERLYVRGRHQTKHGKSSSRATFGPKEGCAGKAFAENRTLVMKLKTAYDEKNPQAYYDECRETWGLNEKSVKQLNEKVAYVLSIPVRYHGQDRVVGVVSIDCMVPVDIPAPIAKKAEQGISHYSAVFKLKEAS